MSTDGILVSIRRSCRRVMVALFAVGVVVGLCAAYGFFIEPEWLRTRAVSLSDEPTVRLVHVSDIHYKGDTQYLQRVIAAINAIEADFVCLTGDLVEELEHLAESLELLSGVNKPMYGVPGNHDEWARLPFERIETCFKKTGGAWLGDSALLVQDHAVEIVGNTGSADTLPSRLSPLSVRVLLTHYPSVVDGIKNQEFDLMLAGHSHGGQVRLPFIGALITPYAASYDRGLFQTPAGPLYVNPGIGTFYYDIRFGCRPEITVIEL